MIRSLLGAPDKISVNPHWSTWAPMRLFRWERVIRAESEPRFKLHQKRKRRQAAQKIL
jgi:hypothetical protein